MEKVCEFEKITQTWRKYVDLDKVHWFEIYTNLRKCANLKKVCGFGKKIQEFESAQSKPGESAAKPVRIESRDEPCPVSIVEGASCLVSKLRDQI